MSNHCTYVYNKRELMYIRWHDIFEASMKKRWTKFRKTGDLWDANAITYRNAQYPNSVLPTCSTLMSGVMHAVLEINDDFKRLTWTRTRPHFPPLSHPVVPPSAGLLSSRDLTLRSVHTRDCVCLFVCLFVKNPNRKQPDSRCLSGAAGPREPDGTRQYRCGLDSQRSSC